MHFLHATWQMRNQSIASNSIPLRTMKPPRVPIPSPRCFPPTFIRVEFRERQIPCKTRESRYELACIIQSSIAARIISHRKQAGKVAKDEKRMEYSEKTLSSPTRRDRPTDRPNDRASEYSSREPCHLCLTSGENL